MAHYTNNNTRKQINIPQMLAKLDTIYNEEEKILFELNKIQKAYEQIQEDKELLQNLIMYYSNKKARQP